MRYAYAQVNESASPFFFFRSGQPGPILIFAESNHLGNVRRLHGGLTGPVVSSVSKPLPYARRAAVRRLKAARSRASSASSRKSGPCKALQHPQDTFEGHPAEAIT